MKLTKVQKIILIMAIMLLAGGTAIWAVTQYLASEVIYEKGETQITVEQALNELNASIPYKITYSSNGGSGAMSKGSKYIGENYLVASSSFVAPTGKYFKEWNTSDDGTGTSYAPGVTYSADAELTLYAIWEKRSGSITEMVNSGDYGDKVNYSVTVNGVTLDKWQIFYNDGRNVIIKYADYLPNTTNLATAAGLAVETGERSTYGVKSNKNRKDLMDILNDTTKWSTLLTSDLSNKAAYAKGGVDLETWVASWNANGYTYLYTAKQIGMSDGLDGYYIGIEINPSSPSQSVKSSDGFSNTMYFPYKKYELGCQGYWLTSPSVDNAGIMNVQFNSVIYDGYYNSPYYGLSPVIYLPSSVLGEQLTDGSWNLK